MMQYETLKHVFFSRPEEYEQIYQNRLNSDTTIKLNFFIGDRQAFFTQDNEVINLVYTILRNDQHVSDLCHGIPAAISYYQKKCLIDEIVTTNSIEGVHSTRREVESTLAVLSKQSEKKNRKHRFEGLISKYSKLLSAVTVPLFTCRDVRNLYDEIVMPEVIAENPQNVPDGTYFRAEQVTVYDAYQNPIHTGAYPEKRMIELTEQAFSFLADETLEPLYRICVFHYLLEYIHPFYDGNGRLGRFIFSLGISTHLYGLTAFRISETIQENIRQYYDVFKICNDFRNRADVTPFLITMLDFIRMSQENLISAIKTKLSQGQHYRELLMNILPPGKNELTKLGNCLIDATLYGENGLTKKELTDLTGKSPRTINTWLKTLEDKDLLYVVSYQRTKYYQINTTTLEKSS